MYFQTLDRNWELRPLAEFNYGIYPRDAAGWLPTRVPGHWQQHPELERHAGKVVYRCRFSYDPDPSVFPQRREWLRLNGIFYWSQPYLNGVDLGRHEGYFLPHECEVSGLLDHENSLLVEVDCPDEHDKFGKRMITGVFSHWDCLDPLANPGGIWLPVELHHSGPVHIHAVRCHTEAYTDAFAQIRYAVDLDAAHAGPVTLRWTIAPRTFDAPVQVLEQRRRLRAGRHSISGLFKLHEPRLWWTHDLGRPDLYTLTLELLTESGTSDCYSFGFGVRRFELQNWIPHLNGVRFLVKGNNYPPGDMRIATMTAERCARDLELVRNGHMNLLRVHAHVDHPAFYEAADAAGVLLWQDMPLQWLYKVVALPEALRQARGMVHLLYNHPSVAIWCMHNEPVFIADTADETLLMRLRTYNTAFGFSWNRDVMDSQLKFVAERADPQRPVVRSSGEFDWPPLRRGTDAHAYFGWYRSYGTLRDAEILRRRFPGNLRFMTEFGAQSFPNVESCLKFMPADVKRVDFELLAQRHGFQSEIMANWIDWRAAETLEELVELSQDYQALVNRFYIDRLRYHKYRPTGGIVPFLLLDPHPAVLWSIIDYWRVPKRSYEAMRLAFSPQYTFTLFEPRSYLVGEGIELPIYVVNDAQHTVRDVNLIARLRGPDDSELARVEHIISLERDCLAWEVDRLRLTPQVAGRYTLDLWLYSETALHNPYQIEVVALG